MAPSFASAWLGALIRPGRTFAALAAAPAPARAAAAVLLMGAGHAAFVALLAAGGHRPSAAAGLPVAPEDYYRVAALYLAPLHLALWCLFAAVAHAVARALGGRGGFRAVLTALGFAYAVPLTLFFVLPDLVVYLAAGHAALGPALRYYAPLAPLTAVALATAALRATHQLPRGRALAAALAGFIALALPAAALIR